MPIKRPYIYSWVFENDKAVMQVNGKFKKQGYENAKIFRGSQSNAVKLFSSYPRATKVRQVEVSKGKITFITDYVVKKEGT